MQEVIVGAECVVDEPIIPLVDLCNCISHFQMSNSSQLS